MQKRISELGEDSKESIDRDIHITKDAISAVRLTIR